MLQYKWEGLDVMITRMATADGWQAKFVRKRLLDLGKKVADIMVRVIKPNRYTGQLEESIRTRVVGGYRIEIFPTARSGKWDRGLILERGTRPIPNVPWAPIKLWADFRGLPAGKVWYKIKTRGVSAHPFLERVRQRPDFMVAVEKAARAIGVDLAHYSLQIAGRGAINEKSDVTVVKK